MQKLADFVESHPRERKAARDLEEEHQRLEDTAITEFDSVAKKCVGTCNWETKEKLRGGNVHGVDRMVKAMYDAVPNRRQLRDAVNAMYVTSIWIILFFTLAWQVGPAESAKSPAGEHTVTQWWTTEPMEC
eukprot:gene47276-13571_t